MRRSLELLKNCVSKKKKGGGINNFPNCPEKEKAAHSGQTRKSLKAEVKSEPVTISTGPHLLAPEHL